ncbi:hypothetical protein ACE4Z7_24885, partial [Salmonella enterica]|uniref:hypothetical protein n=1 Tax=Salmonella enterica TaxID=28901 RepID=UPI003D2A8565
MTGTLIAQMTPFLPTRFIPTFAASNTVMLLITKEEIEATDRDPLAFIILFAEKYYNLIAADTTGTVQQR